MKTLVIHPKDPSTDFLSVIYANKDWTVITETTSRRGLKEAIKTHDRIIMMGHGTEDGLIGFNQKGFIINSSMVYALREKECICIWCNADQFVRRYGLKGFHTGMIISEYEEALYCCVSCVLEEIEASNKMFADCVSKVIDLSASEAVTQMKKIYQIDNNNVVLFNLDNIYSS